MCYFERMLGFGKKIQTNEENVAKTTTGKNTGSAEPKIVAFLIIFVVVVLKRKLHHQDDDIIKMVVYSIDETTVLQRRRCHGSNVKDNDGNHKEGKARQDEANEGMNRMHDIHSNFQCGVSFYSFVCFVLSCPSFPLTGTLYHQVYSVTTFTWSSHTHRVPSTCPRKGNKNNHCCLDFGRKKGSNSTGRFIFFGDGPLPRIGMVLLLQQMVCRSSRSPVSLLGDQVIMCGDLYIYIYI